ncbi:MAG: hypothetical protein FJ263_06710 [Planctomycetes bacterium]|nr:hypothetical protein [Planctomycetota bacterium]
MELPTKKLCKMCCMEIPAGAKKCPYCQHWQKSFLGFLCHPATGIFVALLVYGFLLGYVFNNMFNKGESFANYSDSIQVVESKIQFGENQCGPTVVILGKVHNLSPLGWKEVVFHADIFDAEGNLVDMAQEENYSYIIPAGATQSFKISFRREFPLEKYVKHEINVISAKDERAVF